MLLRHSNLFEGGADTYNYPPQVEPKIVTPTHLTSVGVSWDDWKPTAGPALLGVSGNCNGQPDTDPPWNKEPHSIRLAWESCADWINFTGKYCP